MNVGDFVTVYHYRKDLTQQRVCDLGCKHQVTFHESKRITITAKRTEVVPHLGYDKPAIGDVFDAVDYQGRVYHYEPTWDGPGAWHRADGKAFWARPIIKMDAAFTLDNKRIV